MVLSFLLQTNTAAPSGIPTGFYIQIALVVAIMYFLLFRPMQRQRKEQQKMLTGLQNGDTVVTSGGVIGTIVSIDDDDTLVIRVKPNDIKLQVTRGSVSSLRADKKASVTK
ncbi:MAG TPA: preprotein translocase subunit YajC [Bryobacteraceae bacterium]|nr:preprotein translocase subunit YajC [Bryobacteraceae bacterium]